MTVIRHPSLFQINTRVWLTELARNLHRPATLDDIPDAELDRLTAMGFNWVWFLSVWQTGPGLIANAYVSAGEARAVVTMLAPVGILVTLSAFVILYKSYQARGYLQFLGNEAKLGGLREEDIPLIGWPSKRIKGWRKKVWRCPWLGKASELLEPFFFLPALLILAWLFVLLKPWLQFDTGLLLLLSVLLAITMLSLLCITWVRWQEKDEQTVANLE